MVTTDDVLIRRILQNDRDALTELVERHHRQVYNLALRISGSPEDAEEIAQEAFIRVYNSLGPFRFESKFSTWLYRIVSNLAIICFARGTTDISARTVGIFQMPVPIRRVRHRKRRCARWCDGPSSRCRLNTG